MDVGQFVLLPNILYLLKHLLLPYPMVLFALPELISMFTLENSDSMITMVTKITEVLYVCLCAKYVQRHKK